MSEIIENMIQGSAEWHALRRTKITATDAPIIMGANPWKSIHQLYEEKSTGIVTQLTSERALRGIMLEPMARDLFNMETGLNMSPVVVVSDWQMASLDGYDKETGSILEIKCPGDVDHDLAKQGKIPQHYYPQLQHQMYVCGVQSSYYFSFDGIDGIIVNVPRNDEFIEKMIIAEKKFYDQLMNGIAPEKKSQDWVERDDTEWLEAACKWQLLSSQIESLEVEKEELRNRLILLATQRNSRGCGISLAQVQKKGQIDYSKIPQLREVDLEKYRKETTTTWRVSCQ
jgi:putative phage-type endonuclease